MQYMQVRYSHLFVRYWHVSFVLVCVRKDNFGCTDNAIKIIDLVAIKLTAQCKTIILRRLPVLSLILFIFLLHDSDLVGNTNISGPSDKLCLLDDRQCEEHFSFCLASLLTPNVFDVISLLIHINIQ
jgi:hypothetical protein